MLKKVLFVGVTFLFAFFILGASLLRVSSANYSFHELENLAYLGNPNGQPPRESDENQEIKYFFPYPGKILPDSSLWYLKSARDKLWLAITTNQGKKAELLLLFADKRMAGARVLFEKGKPNMALSTLSKAEKYLELADTQNKENRKNNLDTVPFDLLLANASLKHIQELKDLSLICPDDIKPEVIKLILYPTRVYESSRDHLLSKGVVPPANPFSN